MSVTGSMPSGDPELETQALEFVNGSPGGISAHAVWSHCRGVNDIRDVVSALNNLKDSGRIKKERGLYCPLGGTVTNSIKHPEDDVMNVEVKGKKQWRIYDALKGRMNAEQLQSVLPDMTIAQIQAQISQLKKKGLVKSEKINESGKAVAYYERNAGGSRPSPDSKSSRIRNKPTKTRSKKSVKKKTARKQQQESKDMETFLQRCLDHAQENLDDYLASVSDPQILIPLKNARDGFRNALNDLRGKVEQ